MSGFVIGYTGASYDRASERRIDSLWLAAEVAAGRGRVLPVWRDHNLVAGFPGASPRAAYLNGESAAALVGTEAIFLGLADGAPVFAVDVSARTEAEAAFGCGIYAEIRGLSALLPLEDATLLATARGLCHWHCTHRFCGTCGAPTECREAGHLRACTDPDCARMHYPRLDPAVIMLVESFDPVRNRSVCLLGHNVRFPQGVYSTLAGFVEIGETLEQAVRREVKEEVGVAVDLVTYRASQPWPFPSSIMLGFHAQGVFAPPTPDGVELSDARWLTPEDLETAADWEAEGAPLRLPRKDSIARFLIESWWTDHRG